MIARKKTWAFTIIELVVVMAIVSSVLAVSISKFRKNNARTRLNITSNEVLNLALYAQSYASLKKVMTTLCLMDDDLGDGATAMVVAYPNIADASAIPYGTDPTAGGTYAALKVLAFDSGVTFCQSGTFRSGYCSKYTEWKTSNYCIPFDTKGYIGIIDPSVTEKYLWTSICIISKDVGSQASSAREIEITEGGMINLVPLGETGDNNTADSDLWGPVMTAGEGPCSNLNIP